MVFLKKGSLSLHGSELVAGRFWGAFGFAWGARKGKERWNEAFLALVFEEGKPRADGGRGSFRVVEME